ncbi:toprim domain-containing protein [Kistimonas scapharcae]|uniref:Toprim domain-containing protein n=1 Tax=Kistimonas scapharcae TaxID=1036133 RepID=A0ABP8V042_9GAMM
MFIDYRTVQDHARGQWLDIFRSLAPALDDAVSKNGRHVRCPNPQHDSPDGFRLFKDSNETGGGICSSCGSFAGGISLLQWVNDWDFKTTINQLAGHLNLTSQDTVKPVQRSVQQVHRPLSDEEKKKGEQRKKQMNAIWQESLPLEHAESEVGRMYFVRRGFSATRHIVGLKPVIRFHPAMPYYHEGTCQGNMPCLVSLVSDKAGKPVTLHRTFLDKEGKKLSPNAFPWKESAPSAKKIMPLPPGVSMTGGAIRIGEPGAILGVAEGIETALAVSVTTGQTVWPCVSASMLQKFIPPAGVREIWIWCDLDRSKAGVKAAHALKSQLTNKGIQCRVNVPPMPLVDGEKSRDWADVMTAMGRMGFPAFRTH